MNIPDEKWIEHFQTTTRTAERVESLYKLLGHGAGMVEQVRANRDLCDNRELNHQRDKDELWDYIKTHKGKSLVIGAGSAGVITAVCQGIKELWHLAH